MINLITTQLASVTFAVSLLVLVTNGVNTDITDQTNDEPIPVVAAGDGDGDVLPPITSHTAYSMNCTSRATVCRGFSVGFNSSADFDECQVDDSCNAILMIHHLADSGRFLFNFTTFGNFYKHDAMFNISFRPLSSQTRDRFDIMLSLNRKPTIYINGSVADDQLCPMKFEPFDILTNFDKITWSWSMANKTRISSLTIDLINTRFEVDVNVESSTTTDKLSLQNDNSIKLRNLVQKVIVDDDWPKKKKVDPPLTWWMTIVTIIVPIALVTGCCAIIQGWCRVEINDTSGSVDFKKVDHIVIDQNLSNVINTEKSNHVEMTTV